MWYIVESLRVGLFERASLFVANAKQLTGEDLGRVGGPTDNHTQNFT